MSSGAEQGISRGSTDPEYAARLTSISRGAWWPVATYVFVLSVITFGTTFLVPETRGRT